MEPRVFSTCPQSADFEIGAEYIRHCLDVARWSEDAGYEGILVYADNRLADPWVVSQAILQNTRSLAPLVAVQPLYMHPYSVAKLIATFAHLYSRRTYVNMIAGGFGNDLASLNDSTPHDRRYDRLVEYAVLIKRLLAGDTVTFEGEFYQVKNLSLRPSINPSLLPDIFVSGSSDAGLAAARTLGAVAVKYPKSALEEISQRHLDISTGIRIGVIARPTDDEAWQVAEQRFPEDRRGQIAHQLAMRISDSAWHRQLSALPESGNGRSPFWMAPFQNHKTFCPYLVGSYESVAQQIAIYLATGHETFILDIPPDENELWHTKTAFDLARVYAGNGIAA